MMPIESVSAGSEVLGYLRRQHPDANHACFAYRLGMEQRFSDDGEPGGTAGRPILEVLTRRNLDYCLAVVVRYFGGTKLGAGGLVRAYSGAVAKALDEAGTKEIKDRSRLAFVVPFDAMDKVHRRLAMVDGLDSEAAYSAEGLILRLELFDEDKSELMQVLVEDSRGRIVWLEEDSSQN